MRGCIRISSWRRRGSRERVSKGKKGFSGCVDFVTDAVFTGCFSLPHTKHQKNEKTKNEKKNNKKKQKKQKNNKKEPKNKKKRKKKRKKTKKTTKNPSEPCKNHVVLEWALFNKFLEIKNAFSSGGISQEKRNDAGIEAKELVRWSGKRFTITVLYCSMFMYPLFE